MITKGERTELRSIVRQQFKVLRSEVTQRHAELLATLDDEIAEKFAKADDRWGFVLHEIGEAEREANRRINDALREYTGSMEFSKYERSWVRAQIPERSETQQRQLDRRAAAMAVDARVRGALSRLERQEADILRSLALGALESDEARAFLGQIPSVGELVPAARLAELLGGAS